MGSYAGPLPSTDEYQERIDNAEHIQAGLVGAKRVVLYDASGNVITPESIPTGLVSGTTTVTTAGTAVQINAGAVTIKGIWLSGDIIAAIPVVVGDSSVVGNVSGQKGLVLIPGNDPKFLAITQLNLLWVDAQNNGGKLAWTYMT